MKKFLTSLLAAAMLVATLTACGNGSTSGTTNNTALYTKPTGNVELNVWYAVSGVTGETFAAQVEAYQKANPNIKINLSYAGSYADAATKISANLATGTAPELALISAAPLYTGATGDFSIETLIEDPAFNKTSIYDGVWDYVKYQGRICAIPYGISVPVLYYNKDIMKAAGIDIESNPPKTWDELYAMAEKAQKNGNINNSSTFYGFETSDAPWLFKSMLAQNGNTIIQGDGANVTPVYNDAKALTVGQFWQKLVNNGLMPVGEHSNSEKAFLAGNCAFIVASSIRLARWDDSVINYGALALPGFGGENAVALGGNMLATFTKDETKLAAAWDLIKYLTNAENHTEFSLTTGYLPIHSSAMNMQSVKDAVAEDPRQGTVYGMMENSWSYTHFDAMGTMDNILRDTLNKIESGEDVQKALDAGVAELKKEM